LFLEIIGGLASVASISGITAKELIPFISDPDKKLFEKYFSYLEGKKVLIAPFDSEVSHAVIKSLESIKEKTEQLRLDIKSKQAQHLLLDLIHTLSQNLMLLYKHQNSIDEVLFYKSLQKVRVKFASIIFTMFYV
jgi:bifunctional ADP-heptose synthase (sugar kinase/adenylyltransferase)